MTAMTRTTKQFPVFTEAMTFHDLRAMADYLLESGFLPSHFRHGSQVVAVILTGRELGMPPMRAIRSLSMIKGKVIESADSQLARFKADGGRADFTELTDSRAELRLRHPNGDEHTEVFTIEDARRANLSGENWSKYPRAMLRSRAITAGLKSVGWEGAVGEYDPDEAAGFSETIEAKAAEPEVLPPTPVKPAPKPKQSASDVVLPHLRALQQASGFDDVVRLADGFEETRNKLGEKWRHIVCVAEARAATVAEGMPWEPDEETAKVCASIDQLLMTEGAKK